MEILELSLAQFITALLSIVMIDLVLSGDNAIVIALACRNLPKKLQMRAIFIGTGGAILVRVLATLIVVWLLRIKGLMLVGGLLLVWIAYKLLAKPEDHESIKCRDSMLSAIGTIIAADMIMGLDNMLAVAGASHGSYVMVLIGLVISIPIMIFASTLIIKLTNRFPIIIDIGAAIIALTAGKMMTEESFVHDFFGSIGIGFKFVLIAGVVVGVLVFGRRQRKKVTALVMESTS